MANPENSYKDKKCLGLIKTGNVNNAVKNGKDEVSNRYVLRARNATATKNTSHMNAVATIVRTKWKECLNLQK